MHIEPIKPEDVESFVIPDSKSIYEAKLRRKQLRDAVDADYISISGQDTVLNVVTMTNATKGSIFPTDFDF